ncbi:uncharacterized protein A4U43_C06F10670 [Asparagus officinalis]|uniref:Uncharacterized protein n=1 Tax=Asparagus officinalis TaxID=4686 RepID=A0A5P1EQ37_ASPOF|nr:uncharacterized protein A4U43_C06F10670 [Asparagus officinalis]
MLLAFRDAIRLTTKKVTYEEGCQDPNPDTLKLLKELSLKRRAIEESLNRRSTIKESVAENEMFGGGSKLSKEKVVALMMGLPMFTDECYRGRGLFPTEDPSRFKAILRR